MTATGSYVLDSFALLAYLGNEPGADLVRGTLEQGQRHAARVLLSVINFGECLYIIEREQGLDAAHLAIAAIDPLPIEVVPATRERTFAAAHIKAHHRLSYADAFAVSLALEHHATVLTGDPEFQGVEPLIPILWLPR